MSDGSSIQITVDRDSVCAGDDCVSHEARFTIAASSNVLELLAEAWSACPLASIAGGQATWLIDVAGSDNCIGVIAQQWNQPNLLIPPETMVGDLFRGEEPRLYFRYWCQASPDAVLGALQTRTGYRIGTDDAPFANGTTCWRVCARVTALSRLRAFAGQ
jgi:hypothetical protein